MKSYFQQYVYSLLIDNLTHTINYFCFCHLNFNLLHLKCLMTVKLCTVKPCSSSSRVHTYRCRQQYFHTAICDSISKQNLIMPCIKRIYRSCLSRPISSPRWDGLHMSPACRNIHSNYQRPHAVSSRLPGDSRVC